MLISTSFSNKCIIYLLHTYSLGIERDGIGNTCEGSERIMSENAGKAAEAYHWSHCSVDYLQAFLRFSFFQIKIFFIYITKVKKHEQND